MIEYKDYTTHDLSELLRDKKPRGVLVLEGNLFTVGLPEKDKVGNSTWVEVVAYASQICENLGIPYLRLTREDFHRGAGIENDSLRGAFQQEINFQADLGLYVAGCLCCTKGDRLFNWDIEKLIELFRSDRVFISSNGGGAYSRGYDIKGIPRENYFLV